MIDVVCPGSVETDPLILPTSYPNKFSDRAFTFSEFCVALDSRGDGSALGLDSIDYLTLKQLPIQYKLLLTDIFNELHASCFYPDTWTRTFIS